MALNRWDLGLTYVPYFDLGEPKVINRDLVKACQKKENTFRQETHEHGTQRYGKIRPICILGEGRNPYDLGDTKTYYYAAECRSKPSPHFMDPVRMRVDRWKLANLAHESYLLADPAQVVLIDKNLTDIIRPTGQLTTHDQQRFLQAGKEIEDRRERYRQAYESKTQETDPFLNFENGLADLEEPSELLR